MQGTQLTSCSNSPFLIWFDFCFCLWDSQRFFLVLYSGVNPIWEACVLGKEHGPSPSNMYAPAQWVLALVFFVWKKWQRLQLALDLPSLADDGVKLPRDKFYSVILTIPQDTVLHRYHTICKRTNLQMHVRIACLTPKHCSHCRIVIFASFNDYRLCHSKLLLPSMDSEDSVFVIGENSNSQQVLKATFMPQLFLSIPTHS